MTDLARQLLEALGWKRVKSRYTKAVRWKAANGVHTNFPPDYDSLDVLLPESDAWARAHNTYWTTEQWGNEFADMLLEDDGERVKGRGSTRAEARAKAWLAALRAEGK